jgi:hypothetical protein
MGPGRHHPAGNDLFLMHFSPRTAPSWALSRSAAPTGNSSPAWCWMPRATCSSPATPRASQSLDFGGGELLLIPGRGQQGFLALLTPEGAHLGSLAFGGDGTDSLVSLAGGPGGAVAFGTFEQTVHFGDAERTSLGARDLFLLSIP